MCLSKVLRVLPTAQDVSNPKMKMLLEECVEPAINKLQMVQDKLKIDDFFLSALVAESVLTTEEKKTILKSSDDNRIMQDTFFSILSKNRCNDETIRVVLHDALKQTLQHTLAEALLHNPKTSGSYHLGIEEKKTIELRKLCIILDFMSEINKFSSTCTGNKDKNASNQDMEAKLKNFSSKLLNSFIIAMHKADQGHNVTLSEVIYCHGRRRSTIEEDDATNITPPIPRRNSDGDFSNEFQKKDDKSSERDRPIKSLSKRNSAPSILEASMIAFLAKHGKSVEQNENDIDTKSNAPFNLESQPWYYNVSAGEAYKLLMREKIRNGSFLVRPSISSVDFTLSWKADKKVINTKIVKRKGLYSLRINQFNKRDEPTCKVSTLADLIEHIVSNGKGKETVTGQELCIMYPLTPADILNSCKP